MPLTSRVRRPPFSLERLLPEIPDAGGWVARGTYLRASAAQAVHQALWLQVGVPALAGGVSLPMEKAEHVRAWQTKQGFVSSRRLQPKDHASSLLFSGSRKDVIWTTQAKVSLLDMLSQSGGQNVQGV